MTDTVYPGVAAPGFLYIVQLFADITDSLVAGTESINAPLQVSPLCFIIEHKVCGKTQVRGKTRKILWISSNRVMKK